MFTADVRVQVPPRAPKNGYPKGYPFLFIYGLEPIYMQVSGGRLLSPVQKLVTTSIFLSCGGKEKCKSSPASRTKETVERLSLFLSVDPGQNRSPLKFLIEGNPRGFFVSCKQSLSIRNYFRLFSSTPSATGLVLPGLLRFEEWMNIQPAEYVKTRI